MEATSDAVTQLSPLERLEILGSLATATISRLPTVQFPHLRVLRVRVAQCDVHAFHVPARLEVDMNIQRGFPPTRLP